MPRDLFPKNADSDDNLTAAVVTAVNVAQGRDAPATKGNTVLAEGLHVFTQTLTPSDLESCTVLESAAFPPHERATREKVSATPHNAVFLGKHALCDHIHCSVGGRLTHSDRVSSQGLPRALYRHIHFE